MAIFFLQLKIFLANNYFGKQFFLANNFFWQTIFLAKNFSLAKTVFWPKLFFGILFLSQQIFCLNSFFYFSLMNIFLSKFVFGVNSFWQNLFFGKKFVHEGPKNLPLKFGQNQVSNRWDNPDIEFLWWIFTVIFMSNLQLLLGWVYFVVELGFWQ